MPINDTDTIVLARPEDTGYAVLSVLESLPSSLVNPYLRFILSNIAEAYQEQEFDRAQWQNNDFYQWLYQEVAALRRHLYDPTGLGVPPRPILHEALRQALIGILAIVTRWLDLDDRTDPEHLSRYGLTH